MALTQTDLDALDTAIAAGKLSVRIGDRLITYQALPDLLAARAHVARVISQGSAPSTRGAPRYQQAVFDDD